MLTTSYPLLNTLIYLVIVGLIAWIIYWFINFCNPPEPFKKVCLVLWAIAVVAFLINFLLKISGHSALF